MNPFRNLLIVALMIVCNTGFASTKACIEKQLTRIGGFSDVNDAKEFCANKCVRKWARLRGLDEAKEYCGASECVQEYARIMVRGIEEAKELCANLDSVD